MEIRIVKPFNGIITRLDQDRGPMETWELMDRFIYGFSARDKGGTRVDPQKIRQKPDGGYVIIEFKNE